MAVTTSVKDEQRAHIAFFLADLLAHALLHSFDLRLRESSRRGHSSGGRFGTNLIRDRRLLRSTPICITLVNGVESKFAIKSALGHANEK